MLAPLVLLSFPILLAPLTAAASFILLLVLYLANNNKNNHNESRSRNYKEAAESMSQNMQRIHRNLAPNSQRVTLSQKPTSNVFRKPGQQQQQQQKTHVRLAIHPSLSGIYTIDCENMSANVGGMTRYDTLVDATLAHGLVPLVTPELVSITVGGAISGVGVESSSWKYGMVHNTVSDMSILLADGSVCETRRGEQLFHAIPNSYGTLGYVLRATLKLMPATPYVQVQRIDVDNDTEFEAIFDAINDHCMSHQWLFVEAVIFSKTRACLLLAKFATLASADKEKHNIVLVDPRTDVFHKVLRNGPTKQFYMHTRDYLFRWDPDGFFSTPDFLHQRLVRAVCRPLLRSDRLRALAKKLDAIAALFVTKPSLDTHEEIVQDLGVSLPKGAPFVRWIDAQLDLYPIWLCPFTTRANDNSLLWRMPQGAAQSGLAVDVGIGFGVKKKLPPGQKPGHYTRQVERELTRLNGVKGLYSDSYYGREEFWSTVIDGETYDTLKRTYDPQNRFPTVYEKVCGTNA